MKNTNFKKTFGLLATLTIALSMIMLPTINADVPQRTKTTYAFCTVTPSQVGVGQETLVWMGISDYLNIVDDGWEGITVTVTKPDNTTETLGPFRTDSTGSTGTPYIPTMVGTYYFESHFPAQWYNWTGRADVYYLASTSDKFTLTVTEQGREYYTGTPLPTEYWSRPINAQNREWSEITGNWLWGQSLNNYPYYNWRVNGNSYAPETGHILWTKEVTHGGLAGADTQAESFFHGDAYEGYFLDSIIINGVLYYNEYQAAGRTEQNVIAIDLKTGEELWEKNFNNTRMAFGQVLKYNSYNTQGAYSYLWTVSGSTWNAYDPATGRWEYGMVNVPSGTTPILGPNGELIVYSVNTAKGWVTMWNSTLVVAAGRTGSSAGSWLWSQKGTVFDATRGIQWNNTIPIGLPGIVLSALEDRIIGGTDDTYNAHLAVLDDDYSHVYWAISTEKGKEGTILFNTTWSPPSTHPGVTSAFVGASTEEGIMIIALKDTRQLVALSIDTGKQLWGPTEQQTPVDLFTIGNYRRGAKSICDGLVFSGGMGGRLHAYDAANGELKWTFDAKQEYTEMQWSENWPIYLSFIADGKIYLHQAEHSVNQPMPRGAPFICLNQTTGELIWEINIRGTHWGGYPIIGDSTITMFSTYDNQIYALGRGPSSTTITASPKVSTRGSSVILEGTVLDNSPGLSAYEIEARFPNGVAAVSDESQSDWMTYVYAQMSKPINTTGVPVELYVLDSNGNYRSIGTTTTDANGFYSLQWTPEIEGKYTVYAVFAGSESYYSSQAITAFAVDEPAETPAPTQTNTQSAADTYLLPGIIGIIAAIAVVGVVLALLVTRKRP